MDIQQYISSGIIETYVLGMASAEEVRELELLSAQHVEIKIAILSAQADMEQYAGMHAVEPPAGMKEQIWKAIQNDEEQDKHVLQASVVKEGMVSNVIDFNEKRRGGSAVLRTLMAVAIVMIIILSIGLNFYFWGENQNTQHELASMINKQQQMIASNKFYEEKLQQANNMLLNPAMKSIVLAGVGRHTGTTAKLFWDADSKNVYLSLKNMPPPPSGKQYQLWAIVDGQPVDAGVYSSDAKEDVQKMKTIPYAEMFAITIENDGGSATPTMDQMVVAGKV